MSKRLDSADRESAKHASSQDRSPLAMPLKRLASWLRSALDGRAPESGVAQALPGALRFETLEPRLLLSADTGLANLSADAALSLNLTQGDDVVLVQEVGSAGDGGVIVDVSLGAFTERYGSVGVGVRSILADGLGGDDTFRFHFVSVPTLVFGGEGADMLIGPSSDARWEISGQDSGVVDSVRFAGVENLLGAADNQDQFVFAAGGRLSGSVAGGDRGFDTVVLDGRYDAVAYEVSGADSGNIVRDGDNLLFTGMEPVQFTQAAGSFTYRGTVFNDTITLRDIADVTGSTGSIHMEIFGTGETVQFANPTESLTIEAGWGSDTISVHSLDSAFAGDLLVYGNAAGAPPVVWDLGVDSISFANDIDTKGGYLEAFAEHIGVAAGVTLSTRDASGEANDIVFRARRFGSAELENLSPVLGTNRQTT
jgi:hypothetical protein